MVREDFTIVDGEDLGWYPNFMSVYLPYFGAHFAMCLCLNSVLNVKVLVGTFNHEKKP